MTLNYFNRLFISSATFQVAPDVSFGFSNPSFSLINESTNTIEYSFDGVNVHGDMIPSSPSASMVFNNRGYSTIWFRAPFTSGSDSLRIEACEGTIEVVSSDGAVPNFTGGLPQRVIPIAAYNNTNDDVEYLIKDDNNGGLVVSLNGGLVAVAGEVSIIPSHFITNVVNTNFGASTNKVITTSSTKMLAVTCQNLNALIRYLQIHDSSVPVSVGAVPALSFAISGNSSITIGSNILTTNGFMTNGGVTTTFSTTPGTYTAGVAAEQITQVWYAV